MFFDIQCVELFSIIILETGSGGFFGSALPTKLHCSSRILEAILGVDGASRILGDEIGVVEGAFVWHRAPSPVASMPCHPWHWASSRLGGEKRGSRHHEVRPHQKGPLFFENYFFGLVQQRVCILKRI